MGDVSDHIRAYYGDAARAGSSPSGCDDRWGAALYDATSLQAVNSATASLSMGCGNPLALIDLAPGDVVLDLGSGGGLDVIMSAKRVAPGGIAYGLDFLDEMLDAARANAAAAGVTNVVFLRGKIDAIPLADASVDVVISNCVINLAPDKAAVFAEVARVLRPRGRVAISDVVADNGYRAPADGRQWADCGAGALQHDDYVRTLQQAGLVDVAITRTHQTGRGLHAATVRANLPPAL